MSKETGTWESRREAVRQKYYQKILKQPLPTEVMEDAPLPPPPTTGDVPPQDARLAGLFEPVVRRVKRSIGMSATATAPSGTPTESLASSMPADSTSSSSDASTAWMVSPLGLVEQNLKTSIVDPSGSLVPGLPQSVQSSLQALAIGRAEPIEDVILQIAQFFIEAEDERAEGPLIEALTFYAQNYMGASI